MENTPFHHSTENPHDWYSFRDHPTEFLQRPWLDHGGSLDISGSGGFLLLPRFFRDVFMDVLGLRPGGKFAVYRYVFFPIYTLVI